jgi:hypothetical protein
MNTTDFYGLTVGARVVYARRGARPTVQLGTTKWYSDEERALTGGLVSLRTSCSLRGRIAEAIAADLFAARKPGSDTRATFDEIITRVR